MGLGATVTPAGTFEMVTFTLPMKPLRGETATVPVSLAPGTTARVAGLAAIEKPGPWGGCPPPPQEQRMAATRDRMSPRELDFIALFLERYCFPSRPTSQYRVNPTSGVPQPFWTRKPGYSPTCFANDQ